MRLRDETPLDPEVVATLDAIDAVLAGEPVDPDRADVAELALLLAGERPRPDAAFTTLLDEGVRRRFEAPQPPRPPRRRWLWGPAAGLAVAVGVAVAVVVSAGPSGSSSHSALPVTASSSGAATASVPAPSAKLPASAAGRIAPSGTAIASGRPVPAESPSTSSAATALRPAALQPPTTGRKVVQGAQLALTTSSSHVDTVAQEVFDVVGQERGIVNSSTVTATGGPGGYAQFQLSIPSASLPQTMAALSTLQYARVASRTDTSQDVTNQYNAAVTRLADARALRTSLLKQLADASTQAQIDSLTAQIHDAEASISSDLAALRALNNQINYSQVTLTINGGPLPVPAQGSGGGGFSLHQAAHDAGRVLTVAAGAALIALAALLPVSLLVALGWWVVGVLRRRRREQALDAI